MARTEVQRVLAGILPDEAPAYVEAGDWEILVAHVRDGEMYTAIAAERGVTSPTIQQRAWKAARRIERHLAARAFPDLPPSAATDLWEGHFRDKAAVSRATDAELLRHLSPLGLVRHEAPFAEWEIEYEARKRGTLARVREAIPANKVTCPCCGGTGLVDPPPATTKPE